MTEKPADKSAKTSLSFWHPASLICTCFGIGKIPFAPGTWGSLFGFPVFLLIGWLAINVPSSNENAEFYLNIAIPVSLLLLFLLGWKCSNIYEKYSGKHDSKEIVIDEVVGQILTLFVFSAVIWLFDYNLHIVGLSGVLNIALISFVTFRFFDIIKPEPIGWIDRNVGGGLGVMLDDVAAGIAAGIATAIFFMVI